MFPRRRVNVYPLPGRVCDSPRSRFDPSTINLVTYRRNDLPSDAKVIIVGESGVGKTALCERMARDRYDEKSYKPTLVVDVADVRFSILDIPFDLHLWDTAGQERFGSLSAQFYRGADAVLVCFDLGDRTSLERAVVWANRVVSCAGDGIAVFLVGTKMDRDENVVVDAESEEDVARQLGAELWETSAKTGQNVTELIDRVAVVLFERKIRAEMTAVQENLGPAEAYGSQNPTVAVSGPRKKLASSGTRNHVLRLEPSSSLPSSSHSSGKRRANCNC
eukprot:comp20165_c0_seq1/m.39841 comp20165_c0_seq1/g.39841  ORF comp20165_c0_seq1/g.39841 comp20165_c0_seq1/m.39841 type:complete len:277 (-) comp20165_c0_seq1:21-851(-)